MYRSPKLAAAILLLTAVPAMAGSAYVKYVMPLSQQVIKNPYKKSGKKKRLEGCGPIAAASLLGYWKTQKGYSAIMDGRDAFDGTARPARTIARFYEESKTKKAPAKSQGINMSYTMPGSLKKALGKWCDRANGKRTKGQPRLGVERMQMIRAWKKRHGQIRKQLGRGRPVLLLLKNIPASLSSKNNKSFGWHYVVAVGHDDAKEKYYVLSGWAEKDKSTSTGPSLHKKISAEGSDFAHVAISYKELKKAKPGLIWIEEK